MDRKSATFRNCSRAAVFSAGLAAVFLLDVSPALAQQAASVSASPAAGTYVAALNFDPTTVSTTTGQSFTLNVNVDTGGHTTDGTRAVVLYDPSFLTVAGVTNGTIYSSYPANAQSVDNTNGKVVIVGLDDTSTTYAGAGQLASINFTANAPGQTSVKFDFQGQGVTTDSNVADSTTSNDILGQTNTTAISVSAAGATTPPQATAAPVASTPANALPNTANTVPTVALAAIGSILIAFGASLFFLF